MIFFTLTYTVLDGTFVYKDPRTPVSGVLTYAAWWVGVVSGTRSPGGVRYGLFQSLVPRRVVLPHTVVLPGSAQGQTLAPTVAVITGETRLQVLLLYTESGNLWIIS